MDIAHIAGLVAAGLHPSPVSVADFVTFTTHKTLGGARGGVVLCRAEFANIVDRSVCPGLQAGSFLPLVAGKAVTFREANSAPFRAYQQQVLENAKVLASEFMQLGHRIVSGGTDNHLMLVDLGNLGISGQEAATKLFEAGIHVNDYPLARVPSCIRVGTAPMTRRRMKATEMKSIAHLVHGILTAQNPVTEVLRTREMVKQLCLSFPI